jgi:hypothetical protein
MHCPSRSNVTGCRVGGLLASGTTSSYGGGGSRYFVSGSIVISVHVVTRHGKVVTGVMIKTCFWPPPPMPRPTDLADAAQLHELWL